MDGKLSSLVRSRKLVDWAALLEARHSARQEGKIVVWTSGCFDLVHVGHIRSLKAARSFGDILIVGVNSDDSVRKLKGSNRPLFALDERTELLCALECVDYVISFDEQTPEQALRRLQPDIHCKGGDYAPPHGKPIPEAAIVQAYGGRVEFLPLVPGISTSAILARIRA